jgi:hypothetical protein
MYSRYETSTSIYRERSIVHEEEGASVAAQTGFVFTGQNRNVTLRLDSCAQKKDIEKCIESSLRFLIAVSYQHCIQLHPFSSQ